MKYSILIIIPEFLLCRCYCYSRE